MKLQHSTLIFISINSIAFAQLPVEYETVIHNEYNFSISGSQLPWAQAVDECKLRNQTLASIETPEKDDILVQLFVEQQHKNNVTLKGNSWVSATEVKEGVWQWASLNKPVYYRRWFMDGQPDDKDNLNCVYLASTAMLYWRDANCSASMYFICESQAKKENESGADNGALGYKQINYLVILLGCAFSNIIF